MGNLSNSASPQHPPAPNLFIMDLSSDKPEDGDLQVEEEVEDGPDLPFWNPSDGLVDCQTRSRDECLPPSFIPTSDGHSVDGVHGLPFQ